MTALEIAAPQDGRLVFADEHRRLISDSIAPGASPAEIEVFLHVCAHVQLDPMRNQIWLVPRWDSKLRREVFKPQTGIDGMRLIAQRTGLYGGTSAPEFCGPDGVWRDVWLDNTPPAAARVKVTRKDWNEPAVGVAKWDEFKVMVGKAGEKRLAPLWQQFPTLMLAKCGESQALRKAFPAEMSGVYADAETGQADQDRPEVVEVSAVDDQVKEIFDRFMPLAAKLDDVDEFKAAVSDLSEQQGHGPIGTFAATQLTAEQAEIMLAEAVRQTGETEPEPIEDAQVVATVTRDVLVEYCQAKQILLDKARPSKADLAEAVAAHHGTTRDEAVGHVAEWAGV